MALSSSARPRPPVDYSALDLVAVAICGAALAVWAAVCEGSFSFLALLMGELACVSFYLVGSLVASWRRLSTGLLCDLPLRLVVVKLTRRPTFRAPPRERLRCGMRRFTGPVYLDYQPFTFFSRIAAHGNISPSIKSKICRVLR